MSANGRHVGVVVGGSLTKALEVRLAPGAAAGLGQYLTAPLGDGAVVLGMVTDVLLRSAESGPTAWPPPAGDDPASELLRRVLLDTAVYTQVEATPYLEVAPGCEPARARRIPRHFAPVELADQAALDAAFAVDEEREAFRLGAPLGMDDVMVHVDLEKLFERSAGVFGKSGTGKTVIALQLLDAMVASSAAAATNAERTVALVFDMHNDYGWELKFHGGVRASLKQKHPSNVAVYTLEETAMNADGRVLIGTRDIEPEDLDVLQDTGGFTALAIQAAYDCASRFGKEWIDEIAADEPSDRVAARCWKDGRQPEELTWAAVATQMGVSPASFMSLRRGLRRFLRSHVVQGGKGQFSEGLQHVVQTLQGGKSVVVQFGRYGSDMTTYMLVANMLSRRIWEEYRDRTERARGDSDRPNRLVIVIEEAHKFVDKALAGQTIFGQIARELRKYNVTLLVIDQRPSQIDSEVLSQIGTKFCFQLDSEADIEALVGGLAGRSGLRTVIGSLESNRQALVFGHALPMPVVVQPAELRAGDRPGATLRERLGVARPASSAAGLFG